MSLSKRITTQALNHHIRKLGEEFGRKIDHIAQLDARLKGVPQEAALKPSIMRKMTSWLSKISKLHEEENSILDEIRAVETKHKTMRKNNQLRKATPSVESSMSPPQPTGKKKKETLWFWILLYVLFFRNKVPQAPTLNNG